MKKKLAAGILSMALAVGMVFPVSAADTKTENMTVTYTQGESYLLSIPASAQGLSLSTTQDVTTDVGVTSVNLAPGRKIQVSVTAGVNGSGVVELTQTGGTAVLQSSLTLKETGVSVILNQAFAEFTTDGSKTLNFSSLKTQDNSQVKAGSYSGTITFSADITDTTIATP